MNSHPKDIRAGGVGGNNNEKQVPRFNFPPVYFILFAKHRHPTWHLKLPILYGGKLTCSLEVEDRDEVVAFQLTGLASLISLLLATPPNIAMISS